VKTRDDICTVCESGAGKGESDFPPLHGELWPVSHKCRCVQRYVVAASAIFVTTCVTVTRLDSVAATVTWRKVSRAVGSRESGGVQIKNCSGAGSTAIPESALTSACQSAIDREHTNSESYGRATHYTQYILFVRRVLGSSSAAITCTGVGVRVGAGVGARARVRC
jgi:hypothetical protein